MDADLVLIFTFILIMTGIVGGVTSGIVKQVLDYKREKRGMIGRNGAAQDQLATERTQMIEDRLAVLERLATDKSSLLSDEIEALRLDVADRREKEKSQ